MATYSEIKANKKEIMTKFGRASTDTGSPEVQVALITNRINHLNEHFKTNKKDHHSQRGLLKLVGQRKRLLKYLKVTDENRYLKLIDSLSLRK